MDNIISIVTQSKEEHLNIASMITVIFLSIFSIVFLLVAFYIIKSFLSRGPSIILNWIEYVIFLIRIITFLGVYLVLLVRRTECFQNETKACSICSITTVLYYLMLASPVNVVFFNVIQSCLLMINIKQICDINAKQTKTLTNKLKEIDVTKTPKKKFHIIEVCACEFVELILALVLTLSIRRVLNATSTDERDKYTKRISRTRITLFFLMISIQIVQGITIYMLKYYKKKILDNNYYSSNLVMQAIYNLTASKVVFFNDFLQYKSIADFLNSFPFMIYMSLGTLTKINYFTSMLIYFVYCFFVGAMFLYVDKTNKVKIPYILKKAYLLNRFRLSFGEKEKAKLFDEYLLDLSSDESRLMGQIDFSSIDDDSDPEFEMENNLQSSNQQRGFMSVNYYLIFKLLYHYFKINTDTYKELGETFNNKRNDDHQALLSKMKVLFKINSNDIISKEDEELYDNFYNEYLAKNDLISNNNTEYDISANEAKEQNEMIIDSINSFQIDTLFPYYNINCEDILQALNPAMNKKHSSHIAELKNSSNDKSDIFFSHDNFLMFETYSLEKKEFLKKDTLKSFGKSYFEYLHDDIMQNNKQTFIPFIIGIYQIKYCDYQKIIIMYRNPFAIDRAVHSRNSLYITFSEIEEKCSKISSGVTKEKDIINNLAIKKEECENIKEILRQDVEFLMALPFVSFFKLNLYVMTDIDNGEGNSLSGLSLTEKKESPQISEIEGSVNANEDIVDVLSSSRKENGSCFVNEFEKLFSSINDENKKIIYKVFFCEIFRTSIDESLKEMLKGDTSSNKTYSKYIQHQLLKTFNKKDFTLLIPPEN